MMTTRFLSIFTPIQLNKVKEMRARGEKKSTLMKVEAVIWNWKNMRIVSGCIPSGCLAVTGLELHCLMYTHAPSPFPFHYSNLQTAVSCTLGPTPCCSRYLLNTFFTPKTFFHLSCHLQLPWPWKHARGSEREEQMKREADKEKKKERWGSKTDPLLGDGVHLFDSHLELMRVS